MMNLIKAAGVCTTHAQRRGAYCGRGTFMLLLKITLMLATPVAILAETPLAYDWELFAGSPRGFSGSADGVGTAARFWNPSGLAIDKAGNLYVADTLNYTIRKVTPNGTVTTLAGKAGARSGSGNANGTGSAARFFYPTDVTVDQADNLYVADGWGVRKVTQAGVVTSFATGLIHAFSVAADNTGNLFVVDSGDHAIRKVTPDGVTTVFAGSPGNPGSADGTGTDARFGYEGSILFADSPLGIAVDSSNNVLVADTLNYTIRKITSGGVVTTIAGSVGVGVALDGTHDEARFANPGDVAVDTAGNLYIGDANLIRKITPDGTVTTIMGEVTNTVAIGPADHFHVVVDKDGILYASYPSYNIIFKGTPARLRITTPPVLPPAGVHTNYFQPLTAINGTPPFTWSVSSNTLPDFLVLDPSGVITGTPSSAQVVGFRVRVTDSSNQVAEANLRLDVTLPPVAFAARDSLTIAESQTDISVNEGDGLYEAATTGTTTMKAVVFSAQPIDPTTLDRSTSVRITVGGWSFAVTLGDAAKYTPGAKSATFVLQHEECDRNNDHCKVKAHGQLALKFSNKGLALSLTFKTGTTKNFEPLETPVLAAAHRSSTGNFTDTTTASIQVGTSITTIPVTVTGTSQIKTVSHSGDELDLVSVKLKGTGVKTQ